MKSRSIKLLLQLNNYKKNTFEAGVVSIEMKILRYIQHKGFDLCIYNLQADRFNLGIQNQLSYLYTEVVSFSILSQITFWPSFSYRSSVASVHLQYGILKKSWK